MFDRLQALRAEHREALAEIERLREDHSDLTEMFNRSRAEVARLCNGSGRWGPRIEWQGWRHWVGFKAYESEGWYVLCLGVASLIWVRRSAALPGTRQKEN